MATILVITIIALAAATSVSVERITLFFGVYKYLGRFSSALKGQHCLAPYQ